MASIHDLAPTLVFLHYFGGSSHAWDGVVDRLRDEYDCVAPDLRGFGSARAAPGPYTVETYADDIAELVARLGLDRFVLVGHSMGGKIALALAARHPEGLTAVVLLAPSPPTPEPMSETDRADMLAGYGDPAAALATARKITGQPLAPPLLDQVVEDMLRTAEPAWSAWLERGSRQDISAEVGRLSTPALVLSGTQDAAIPTQVLTNEVLPSLERGRLVTVPGAGHLLPLEAPDEVARLIGTMVRDAAGTPEPATDRGHRS